MKNNFIKFTLSGPFAFFKNKENTKTNNSYQVIPKTYVLGGLGAILGLKGFMNYQWDNQDLNNNVLNLESNLKETYKSLKEIDKKINNINKQINDSTKLSKELNSNNQNKLNKILNDKLFENLEKDDMDLFLKEANEIINSDLENLSLSQKDNLEKISELNSIKDEYLKLLKDILGIEEDCSEEDINEKWNQCEKDYFNKCLLKYLETKKMKNKVEYIEVLEDVKVSIIMVNKLQSHMMKFNDSTLLGITTKPKTIANIEEELLTNVKYDIFLNVDNEELRNKILHALKEEEYFYDWYLGRDNYFADISDVEEVYLEDYDGLNRDVKSICVQDFCNGNNKLGFRLPIQSNTHGVYKKSDQFLFNIDKENLADISDYKDNFKIHNDKLIYVF